MRKSDQQFRCTDCGKPLNEPGTCAACLAKNPGDPNKPPPEGDDK